MDDDKDMKPAQETPEKGPVSGGTDGSSDQKPDPAGLDPTRYGDWEKNGRCIDF